MIIQQNVFFLKKWPPGSTRSVSWAPHLKWRIVLLFAVFRCASTDRKSLLKQRNKKNKKRNLLLRCHLSCVNSLIRNKLSFGEGVRRTVRGEGERRRTFKVRSKLLFSRCQHHIKQVTISNASSVCYINQMFTGNYFNLNHTVNVSFSLSLFRFHYNLLFVICNVLL